MDKPLSPHTEQFLAEAVASGMFASKAAVIDAAVDALREKVDAIPLVDEAHQAGVEQAVQSANSGQLVEMTPQYWERLRRLVLATGMGKAQGR